jgi:hypothetical protein
MKKTIVTIAATVIAIFIFSCKGATGPAGADGVSTGTGLKTITFQEGVNGFSGSVDTRIWSNSMANFGSSGDSQVGHEVTINKRFLIDFNLDASDLPAGAIIGGATLSIMSGTSGVFSGPPVFSMYEVTGEWDESTCTWASRTAAALWTAQGADFSAVKASNSVAVTATNTRYEWTISKSIIERQINSPATAYGLIVKEDFENATFNANVSFNTSENATAANRPALTIYYSLP